jgi:hypothetical protein
MRFRPIQKKSLLVESIHTLYNLKNKKDIKKTQSFLLISNLLEKFLKNACQRKVISKTSWTNMRKSGKSAYFRHHVFANNFFWYIRYLIFEEKSFVVAPFSIFSKL